MFNRTLRRLSSALQLTILIAAVFAFSYSPSFAVTLNEALSSSYNNNPELKSAIKELQAVDENMPAAISGALPRASASIERGKTSYDRSGAETRGISDTKSIGVTQPLFRGGYTYSSIKKANNDINAARANLTIAEQQVLFNAVSAYMNLVRDQEVFELAKNNKTVYERHLEATEARFKLGEVTRTDVAQSKASLATANSDLISAERALESSKATFVKITGIQPANIAMPKNPVKVNGNIDELINIALKNNPSIQAAEYNLKSAKNNISIQKSSLLPELNAFANKERQNGIRSSNFISNDPVDSTTLGLSLSIPLYQGGAEYAEVRRAKSLAGKSSFDLAITQNDVRELVIRAYQDFRVAQSLIESDKSTVDSSALALEGVRQEYKAGLRTTIEVLDAEHALFDAKANLITSRANEVVSTYNLLAQLGKLTAKELALNVDIYNPEKHAKKTRYQFIGF